MIQDSDLPKSLQCAIQRNMVVVLMDSLRVPNQGSAPVR